MPTTTARAYGSITIVDIGDLGTLSVYPESNYPNSVIYDPNEATTHSPNWSNDNPLVLIPNIYYGGRPLTYNTDGVTISWGRKVSTGTETSITTTTSGHKIENGSLKVTANQLSPSSAKMITYICHVTYIEPQTRQPLHATGQITYSLIAQPNKIIACSIYGESVFLCYSDGSIKGGETITLTATTTNCERAATNTWQYKTSDGWSTIASGEKSETVEINASDPYFISNVAIIKFNTDSSVSDVHTIVKVQDGPAGDSIFAASLTNEDMYVPCDKDGNLEAGALKNARTTMTVMYGQDEVTNLCSYSITEEVGLTARLGDVNSGELKNACYVTSMEDSTGYVAITATYKLDENTSLSIPKTLYLTKVKAGQNGQDGTSPTIIQLSSDTLVQKIDKSGNASPASFTLSATATTGGTVANYNGKFWVDGISPDGNATSIYRTSEGKKESTAYITTSNQSNYTHYLVKLYEGGTSFSSTPADTSLLDKQTIIVAKDGTDGIDGSNGAQGPEGPAGVNGVSFNLGNYSDFIPCNTSGKVINDYTIEIPFYAFQGITQIPCTAEIDSGTISGSLEKVDISDATGSMAGKVTLKASADTYLGGQDSGTVKIRLTTTSLTPTVSVSQTYTWTKSKQGAITLRAVAPTGNIISNGENAVQLSALLTEGTSTIESGATYQWYKYSASSSNTDKYDWAYDGQTYTVLAGSVDGYASYKVVATYNSKTYIDYIAVYDKNDPLQVEIFSTVGDKLTNQIGYGCIYARVFRDGIELDIPQNLIISDNAPSASSGTKGDYYIKITHIAKEYNNETGAVTRPESGSLQVYIKKEGGWQDCTNTYMSDLAHNYNWTFAGQNGETTSLGDLTSPTNAKFLYIQGSYITNKMQFNLEVEKKS